MTPASLVGRTGVPVERFAAESVRGGVLLVSAGDPPALAARAAELTRLGFTTVVPRLTWRLPSAGSDPGELLADPEVIADLAAARDLLPSGARFVVGLDDGGLYARLAACAVLGLAGAVGFGGRVSYPSMNARRPIQPLDLLPGLSCALQAHFDDDEPAAPAAHVDELERRLATSTEPWQVFRYGRAGDGAGWRHRDAATAWGRARSFLLHLAADRGPAPSPMRRALG